ncbi:MAG TPA: AAA family ATPase [Bacillota bacterium]|nr:AAA family ATPase [Bacillota bacterium]
MTINKLQVKKLRLKNFRNFDDIEFKFNLDNHIFGDNGTGKSSVAEGIVFALYGVNIYGSNHGLDKLIKTGAEPKVAEATVVVSVNDKEYTIRRIVRVVRESGKPEETKPEVFINGTKASSKAVQEKILGHFNAKQFLLSFSPMYYETLSSDELQKVVTSVIMPPTEAEVLAQLTPEEREILEQTDMRDHAKLKKELSELERKKFGLESQAELLKSQLAQLLEKEVPNASQDIKENLAALQRKRKELERTLGNPPTLEEVNTAKLKQQIEQLRGKYLKIKVAFNPGDTCPSCGQTVTAEAVAKLKESADAQKQEIVDEGKTLNAELKAAEEKNAAAKEAYSRALEVWKKKQEELSAVAREIEAITGIAAEIKSRESRQNEITASLEALGKEINSVKEDIQECKVLLGSLSAYELKKNELHAAKIKEHLDRVEVKLFDVVKSTGELTPTFKLLYDGKPQQFLSTSEKVRVGLELAQVFRKLSGINIPCFIDNAECISRAAQYADSDTQYFLAWVVPGKNELEVVDPYGNKITETESIPEEKAS